MLCVLIVKGMSVVVNVMLSLMSVMSPAPALCNLLVCTAVKSCIFGILSPFMLTCSMMKFVAVTVMDVLLFVLHVCVL